MSRMAFPSWGGGLSRRGLKRRNGMAAEGGGRRDVRRRRWPGRRRAPPRRQPNRRRSRRLPLAAPVGGADDRPTRIGVVDERQQCPFVGWRWRLMVGGLG